KVLGVDELHMYDLYTPLVKEVDMTFTFEEAKDIVLKSLAPLGQDYVDIVKEGFENRWIDVVENKGKSSGAYSSGTYGTNPFILMNWQGNFNELYTLLPELCHHLHRYNTPKQKPLYNRNYSTYLAELAATRINAMM